MSRAAKPSTWKSGHCNRANPAWMHEQCRGAYAGATCTCTCHRPPPVEEEPRSEARRAGLHADVPEEDYHRDPALSSTGARLLLPPNCPAIFRWRMDHPETSKAFDIGHAAHMLVLGAGPSIAEVPDEMRASNGALSTVAAKEFVKTARAEGKTPLVSEDAAKVRSMADALKRHPVAGRLFDPTRGKPEQSLWWTDGDTGVSCRARLDWLPAVQPSGRLVIADFKTTAKLNPRYGFDRTVADYGYHQQDAFYCDGIRALGIAADVAFVFVVQSKQPPYIVHVAQLDAEAEQIGHNLNRRARAIFADCLRTDTWPDESGEIDLVSLPRWYVANHLEETYT